MKWKLKPFQIGLLASTLIHSVVAFKVFHERGLRQTSQDAQVEISIQNQRPAGVQTKEFEPQISGQPSSKRNAETSLKPKSQSTERKLIKNLSRNPNPSTKTKETVGGGGTHKSHSLGAKFGVEASYPRISRELGEQGTVVFEIFKDGSGETKFQLKPPNCKFKRLIESAKKSVKDAVQKGLFDDELTTNDSFQLQVVFRLR